MSKEGFFFKEYEKWVKDLNVTQKEFEQFLKTFLLQQAQRVVALAKDRTPKITGALINSYAIGGQEIALKYSVDEEGKEHFDIDLEHSQVEDISLVGDNLQVVIWNPMEYASYVEYGHHLEGDKPYYGKYMLTIAVDSVTKAMPTRFERQFKQFLIDKGVAD